MHRHELRDPATNENFIRNLIKSADFFSFFAIGRRFCFRRVHSTCAHTRRTTEWDANRCRGSHWCIAWLRMWICSGMNREQSESPSRCQTNELYSIEAFAATTFSLHPRIFRPLVSTSFIHFFSTSLLAFHISATMLRHLNRISESFFFHTDISLWQTHNIAGARCKSITALFFCVLTSSHEANWERNSKW